MLLCVWKTFRRKLLKDTTNLKLKLGNYYIAIFCVLQTYTVYMWSIEQTFKKIKYRFSKVYLNKKFGKKYIIKIILPTTTLGVETTLLSYTLHIAYWELYFSFQVVFLIRDLDLFSCHAHSFFNMHKCSIINFI